MRANDGYETFGIPDKMRVEEGELVRLVTGFD